MRKQLRLGWIEARWNLTDTHNSAQDNMAFELFKSYVVISSVVFALYKFLLDDCDDGVWSFAYPQTPSLTHYQSKTKI